MSDEYARMVRGTFAYACQQVTTQGWALLEVLVREIEKDAQRIARLARGE